MTQKFSLLVILTKFHFPRLVDPPRLLLFALTSVVYMKVSHSFLHGIMLMYTVPSHRMIGRR